MDKLSFYTALLLAVLAELVAAAIPTAMVGVILIPIGYAERGYFGIGGEWLLIAIVFCAAYTAIHCQVCRRLLKED